MVDFFSSKNLYQRVDNFTNHILARHLNEDMIKYINLTKFSEDFIVSTIRAINIWRRQENKSIINLISSEIPFFFNKSIKNSSDYLVEMADFICQEAQTYDTIRVLGESGSVLMSIPTEKSLRCSEVIYRTYQQLSEQITLDHQTLRLKNPITGKFLSNEEFILPNTDVIITAVRKNANSDFQTGNNSEQPKSNISELPKDISEDNSDHDSNHDESSDSLADDMEHIYVLHPHSQQSLELDIFKNLEFKEIKRVACNSLGVNYNLHFMLQHSGTNRYDLICREGCKRH